MYEIKENDFVVLVTGSPLMVVTCCYKNCVDVLYYSTVNGVVQKDNLPKSVLAVVELSDEKQHDIITESVLGSKVQKN